MSIDAIYTFDSESYDELRRKTLEGISGDRLKQELAFFKSNIMDLSTGNQKNSLDKRGFVVAINGAWGAGKSTATWALINELDKDLPDHFVVIDRSLLPFGSVNESIATFLNDFATVLKNENIIDISGEIDQFILESTPTIEKLGLTASLGPVSLSKSFGRSRNPLNTNTLIDKFKRLRAKARAVIIVLDDLDRLRPNEVVDVLRMVEKLRVLPGVVVLLPMFKTIINEAIKNDLNLDGPSAATFMRKLTDAEITVHNNIQDLGDSFSSTLRSVMGEGDDSRTWGVGSVKRSIRVSDLVWGLLLHIMIITESTSKFTKSSDPKEVLADSNSEYLKKLLDVLYHSKRYKAGADDVNNQEKDRTASIIAGMYEDAPWPFPVYTTRFRKKDLTNIGNRYAGIVDDRKVDGTWFGEIRALLDYHTSAAVIATDIDMINQLRSQDAIAYDDAVAAKENQSKIPVFIEVFYPLLLSSKSEPIITDNYKRRDVILLARKIAPELTNFTLESRDEDAMRQLFEFVKSKYDQFRG